MRRDASPWQLALRQPRRTLTDVSGCRPLAAGSWATLANSHSCADARPWPGSQLLGNPGEHSNSKAAGDPDELYPVGAMRREPVFLSWADPGEL